MTRGTIGLLGDGQLAQMTILEGQRLGFEMHVLSTSPESPAAQVADRVWVGDEDDPDLLARFAKAVSVVTYDIESLPLARVRAVAAHTAAQPSVKVLEIAQNRIRERAFLRDVGAPMPRVHAIESAEEALAAVQAVGVPCILKTAEQGYDGKGQQVVSSMEEILPAWSALGEVPCVLEERVDFVSEMSVLVAGGAYDQYRTYPVIDNEHRRHILHLSKAPSSLPESVQREATAVALGIARALSLRGLLAVEMFYTREGRVLVNELAPRPHNSGHHTQLSTQTSQFAQLCLAVSGEPLGEVTQQPSAMVNLLGDLFPPGSCEAAARSLFRSVGFVDSRVWQDYLGPDCLPAGIAGYGPERLKVYFYGKQDARVGRKMGHAIALGESSGQAAEIVQELYEAFARRAGGAVS